ncbi:MAG: adenylosuccinate synthase [Chitinophagales bacterium]|nr:adenylosuccinate synthase [Chitinophagales bacterium]
MAVDVLLGLQWGDEGKGKIVDILAPRYDLIARFQGGPNAGHTLVIDGKKIVLHTIPSGVMYESCMNLIGNGVVINPIGLKEEYKNVVTHGIDCKDRLLISKKASLILPTHRALDAASEKAKGSEKIGSTLRGIGPAYMDRTGRNALRVGDILEDDFRHKYEKLKAKHKELLKGVYNFDFDDAEEEEFLECIEFLKSFNIVDGEYFINEKIAAGWNVLAEGAQGSLLDKDFGTYPYVTSSNTVSAAACIGLGISPKKIGKVFGIAKAYCTRVGSGPFPTELLDEDGERLRKAGHEFGATTGRPRRCGWIDLPALKYTVMINGVDALVMTKVDVLDTFEEIKACISYNYDGDETENIPYDMSRSSIDLEYRNFGGWQTSLEHIKDFDALPKPLLRYVEFIEEFLGVNVEMISNGPGREQIIEKKMTLNPV